MNPNYKQKYPYQRRRKKAVVWRGGGSVSPETETGVKQPQPKIAESPECGRDKERMLPRTSAGCVALPAP